MNVLLLDEKDSPDEFPTTNNWELAIDLARAPQSSYANWKERLGCDVISLHDFAREADDLAFLRELFQLGSGDLVDRFGIDWWDVLSLELLGDLQKIILATRLSQRLTQGCQLSCTRLSVAASAIGAALGRELNILPSRPSHLLQTVRRYRQALTRLDRRQLVQAIEDKIDGTCRLRRHVARQMRTGRRELILLPSAYSNVTRTALAFAELLPDREFLLVSSRRNGRPASLQTNVWHESLTAHFRRVNRGEMSDLVHAVQQLLPRLSNTAPEFALAQRIGVMSRFSALLDWGLAHREAWMSLFQSEDIAACISADDANPPTLLPLLLARRRGIPAIACHHGALNWYFAVKRNQADFYLSKSEMETDYLRHVCHLPREKLVIGTPYHCGDVSNHPAVGARWLTFFTEPYGAWGWRTQEVYRELLPRLIMLASTCELKLLIKLHPFESVSAIRRTLRRILGRKAESIAVVDGPTTRELLRATRFAVTVQSSVALECCERRIPVFLCGWLRDSHSGYVEQFRRSGIGNVLESPAQIEQIPRLLENCQNSTPRSARLDPNRLDALLSQRSCAPHQVCLNPVEDSADSFAEQQTTLSAS